MGGILPRASSSASTLGRLKWHLSTYSLPPGKLLMFHTRALFSGTYSALPVDVLTTGVVASEGRGRMISTLLAVERSLNCDRALTRYSVRLRLGFSTRHSTQMSGLMFWLRRYVMRSNAPSGGMKEMVRSFSKRARRTHWWNLMSSSSTVFCFWLRPWLSNSTLSLRPSLHSGMPDRKVRILSTPTTSDSTTVPLLLTSRCTDSTASKNTSFFLCLMPSTRHDTALVTAMGGFTADSILYASVLIYSLRILASVNCGYPKSMTSSSSSYTMTKLSRNDSSSSSEK
mmetsp:Transcript_28823/g.73509  ORF Transcript_28823/g.73509 Transcript_28823/m.73509 type:complete len:285 (-) Transcript_28823:647-1501(-)